VTFPYYYETIISLTDQGRSCSMKGYYVKPIGIIRTPFKHVQGVPIQPVFAKGIKGTVHVASDFTAGLKDLEEFSYLILIYYFHLVKGYKLHVKPFLDDTHRGLFATRAPKRPNPIGISTVKLKEIRKNILFVENVDIIDKTPLLDIKPYVPEFDIYKKERIGWLKGKVGKKTRARSDKRFE
jgi:tRNA-Thr(GGU) m(6)t(6)A37 methyltransferase TsaA